MAQKSKAFDHSKYPNWIDPAKTVPYERNAKIHTDKQIKNLVTSINRFGWQQAGAGTTEEDALRQAFPLGTGGLNRTQAQEKAGRMGTQAADRAKRLEDAIRRQNDAENRIAKLEAAQREIRGTGKTQAQLAEERRATQIKAAGSSMKWTTTNAGGFSNGGYTPKTIRSGAFEIRGSSGHFTVYENGNRIGTVSKLAEAKAIAERRRSRQR